MIKDSTFRHTSIYGSSRRKEFSDLGDRFLTLSTVNHTFHQKPVHKNICITKISENQTEVNYFFNELLMINLSLNQFTFRITHYPWTSVHSWDDLTISVFNLSFSFPYPGAGSLNFESSTFLSIHQKIIVNENIQIHFQVERE